MNIKNYFLLAMSFLFIAALGAQNVDNREKFDIGARVGFNVSNVWDSSTADFRADAKAGFAGGIFAGIPIGKFLGVQPEILLSQKGFKGAGTLLGSPYTFRRTTTYLDIPLQLQIKPSRFVTLVGGPQFSYLLHQKDKYTFGNNSTEQQQEFNNDNIRKNILGFVGGFDFIYQHFVFAGRVGWDFQTNLGDGTSMTPRYKNRWVQVGFGFKI